jgi:extradiol dioxygenase family protein
VWDPDGNLLSIFEPKQPVSPGSGPVIQRVILNAREFGRTVSFYRGTMGFHPVIEATHWVEFDTGQTRIAVHHRPVGDDHPRHAEQPISLVFGADDLTAWCEAMRGRGLHFATAPVMEEFGVYAEATDPDGRVVVFHEPPPPASLEEELAEAFEDDDTPHQAAMRKPVKKASATVSMMTLKPNYKRREAAPKRRRPSATTTSVVSVRGAGPEHARLKPKRTADEKKARTKPAIGRDRKAEIRTIATQKTQVARASKRRPVKRGSANSARRRGK